MGKKTPRHLAIPSRNRSVECAARSTNHPHPPSGDFTLPGTLYVCNVLPEVMDSYPVKNARKNEKRWMSCSSLFEKWMWCDAINKGTNSVSKKTCGIYNIYCNFKPNYTCQTTVSFGTMKDGSILFLTLASFDCFTYSSYFQNGANDMSKMINMVNNFFVKTLVILSSSDHPTLLKFHHLMVKIFIKEL